MSTVEMIPALFLFTLVAAVVVAVIAYGLFMRKRSNRHPTEKPSQAGHTMAPTEADQRN